ncbi:ArnT family glycosyltransferase [Gillisia sp. Q332]|uniref:ArnT family glycosyltransferase n=1 Tax=Gillisia xinjiangensis TaxID=3384765 RepID=UPI00391B717C
MAYLEVAKNIEAGNGVTNANKEIVYHWPPLFSLLLALISKITISGVFDAGIILQVSLFYCFVLVVLMLLRELKINFKLIIFSGVLLIVSQVSINFIYYLSEGLFLVLLLLSFYLFLKWLNTEKLEYLFFSAFFCGLVFLTRYAGIAFIGCFMFFLLFLQRDKPALRIKNFLLFLSVFAIVIAPWFFYQSTFEENSVARKFAVHIIPFSKLLDLLITFAYWFLGSTLAMVLFAGLVLLYVFHFQKLRAGLKPLLRKSFEKYKNVLLLSLLFITIYPLFLIVSISFYDAYTPLDNRILSPLFPFILLLITLFLQILKEQRQKLVLYSSMLFLFLSFSSSVFPFYKNHYENGSGYTKVKWTQSEVVKYLKDKNFDIITYSNGIEIGELHIQKGFRLLPRLSENSKLEILKEEVYSGEAQIIFFKEVNWRNYVVSEQNLMEIFEAEDFLRFEDGFVIRKFTSE